MNVSVVLNAKPPTSSSSAAAAKSAQEETNSVDRKTALISLADALRVDIRDGEPALIIRVTSSSTQSSHLSSDQSSCAHHERFVSSTCLVRVSASSMITGTQSPQKQKREAVAQGNVHICPISLYQHFTKHNSNIDAIVDRKKAAEAAAPTPKASSAVSYTSPSKSSFSFAKGGGGDKLTSSPTRSTPTMSSSAKLKQDGGKVLLIPIASLTKQQSRIICPDASELTLCCTEADVNIDDASNVIKTLIRSKYQGYYINPISTRQQELKTKSINQPLATFETISTSFRGQMISFYIVDATAKSQAWQSAKENEEHLLGALSDLDISSEEVDDNTTAQNAFLEKFIRHQRAEDTAAAYRITASTEINLVASLEELRKIKESRSDTVNFEKQTTLPRLRLCAGLDNILSKINDTLLPPLIHPSMFPPDGPLRPPKGVLLFGPPGVGKSCLAAQVAYNFRTTFGVFVRSVNCANILSDTAVVGDAEKTLTEIFEEAEYHALQANGSLLVLDDVQLICPRRGEMKGSDQIAGTLLALLDGVNSTQSSRRNITSNKIGGLVILAATTDPSSLDPALRRPGRLDVEIEVPVPDESAKSEILSYCFSQFQSDTVIDVSADEIATLSRLAKGFTGADCKLAVKEAVRNALSRDENDVFDTASKTCIKFSDLDHAIRVTKPSAIKSVSVEVPHVSWSDIGGMDHVKMILRESIELPLTHPHLFEMMRVPPPRGILLYGPPGNSKTLMARAIATSGKMNFLAVKGPELLSKWLGESERALASLFRRARLASPSVIFFDELDAIATKRGSSGGSGGDRLLSQLLTELDGVSSGGHSSRVVIVGATNRPDILDPALTRPGRMDRQIYIGLPNSEGRESIFGIGLKGKRCHEDVDVSHLATDGISHGYSGAEIVAICRDAALLAIGEMDMEQPQIRMYHLLEAIKNLKPRTTPEMLQLYSSYGRK